MKVLPCRFAQCFEPADTFTAKGCSETVAFWDASKNSFWSQ